MYSRAVAAVKGKAWSLAIEGTKTPIPQGRGRGYTRRADHYFVQKAVGGPAQEPTLHALRPATRKITTLPGSLPSSSMRVRDRRVPVLTPEGTPLLLRRHLIMIPIIPNAVILRIGNGNAGNRSIMTGGKVARPMLKSRETRQVAG